MILYENFSSHKSKGGYGPMSWILKVDLKQVWINLSVIIFNLNSNLITVYSSKDEIMRLKPLNWGQIKD